MKEIGFRITSWNYINERLFFWLRYYDNAYQLLDYEEFLDSKVIEDDIRLDAFYIYFDDKRKTEKKERVKEERARDREKTRGKGMMSLGDINISKMVGDSNGS